MHRTERVEKSKRQSQQPLIETLFSTYFSADTLHHYYAVEECRNGTPSQITIISTKALLIEQSFFDYVFRSRNFIYSTMKSFFMLIAHHKALGRLILLLHKICEIPYIRIDFVSVYFIEKQFSEQLHQKNSNFY